MANYEETRGFIRGISDKEFGILLNLAFTLNGFKIEKIRRNVLVTNDFLLDLKRIEKRFLRSDKPFFYAAYIDRKQHEYSADWLTDFWLKGNTYSTYFRELEKVFIMDMNKIPKIEVRKDLKKNIKFITGKKLFGYLFTSSPEDVPMLESLYPNESQIWDDKTPEQQKDFCAQADVDYIKYQRLWKYQITHQSKLIFTLQNDTEEKQEKREEQETYSNADSSNLKKYYEYCSFLAKKNLF